MYKTEDEFLKKYKDQNFNKLSMTTDIALFSVSDEIQNNYRKLNKKRLSILLVKRKNYPFKDMWCLPGGFLDINSETLDECAYRVLKQETNIKNVYLEQLYTFSGLDRDPRMRIVSTSYLSLIDKTRLEDKLNDNVKWFDINIEEKNNIVDIVLTNEDKILRLKIRKKLKERTTDRYEFITIENKDIAFDHPIVILSGIERLKNKIEYTDVVFNMMPELFTLSDLQQVYEVILNKKLLDPAFRRIIANKVEKTEFTDTGKGHRPSALFRYKRK